MFPLELRRTRSPGARPEASAAAGDAGSGPAARRLIEWPRSAMSRTRQWALAASVAWLLLGIFRDIEGLGVPSYVPWRPAAVMAFFGVNALAAGNLIAEFLAAALPHCRERRALVLKLAASLIMLACVLGYIEFMRLRAVLGT
ncbi:MAG: hypothetical protein IT514_00295 [Burkholderiales bacterium]|nr:hypothetical protein [Burkholderiales bacterium]